VDSAEHPRRAFDDSRRKGEGKVRKREERNAVLFKLIISILTCKRQVLKSPRREEAALGRKRGRRRGEVEKGREPAENRSNQIEYFGQLTGSSATQCHWDEGSRREKKEKEGDATPKAHARLFPPLGSSP